jgi:hypothetical protein
VTKKDPQAFGLRKLIECFGNNAPQRQTISILDVGKTAELERSQSVT